MFYYLNEIVVVPEYRGNNIGGQLFQLLKKKAEKLGYERFCFITVERSPDDCRRPPGYVDLDEFYLKLDFEKTPIAVNAEIPTIQPDGSRKEETTRFRLWTDKKVPAVAGR